ncbi:LOW QUALITY PROTEIN: hypothetical protein ACHAWF_019041 [Thalassiosira exigua]
MCRGRTGQRTRQRKSSHVQATLLVLPLVVVASALLLLGSRRLLVARGVPGVLRGESAGRVDRTYKTMSLQSLFLQSNDGGIGLLGRPRGGTGPALRWAILGPGCIAHDFASVLSVLGCNVTAVASFSSSRAEAFAEKFSIPNHYGSYDELAADPDVDIVYVATTNDLHAEPTLMMLRAGKNVLVEKPTSIRYEDAKRMYDEAEKRGLFLMTNHWTRFFPLIKYLRRMYLSENGSDAAGSAAGNNGHNTWWWPGLASKFERPHHLGKLLAMHGDFSFVTPPNPSDRYLNRTLGGGATLDVGCYLVELALLAARKSAIASFARRSVDSLDEESLGEAPRESLMPDSVVAAGHGIYGGTTFPVDVESSFALRWGGQSRGVDPSPDVGTDPDEGDDDSTEEFSAIATFQASFRRPSPFEVEYDFERGRIVVHGPGNCPSDMTVYERDPSSGGVYRETRVCFPLLRLRKDLQRYGEPNYPRPEGFAYVVDALERCMAEKGVPGRDMGAGGAGERPGCLELEENTVEEQ